MAEQSERVAAGTVVVGLGNPLMGDDALGLAALERLRDEWDVPADVELVDGGTWGMRLLPVVEDAKRILFIDAVRTGMKPGTETVLFRADIPRLLQVKLSPHQVDLPEVLAVAELRGRLPEDTVVIGIEPERIELGEPMSPVVESKIDRIVMLVVDQLRFWGHRVTPQRRRDLT